VVAGGYVTQWPPNMAQMAVSDGNLQLNLIDGKIQSSERILLLRKIKTDFYKKNKPIF